MCIRDSDLREAGHEYGAATGRPRRVGPIDLVASRYGVFCQGCDEVALTLLDVLDYMETVSYTHLYCPMGLEPVEVNQAYAARDVQELGKLHADYCFNCGSCSFVCPAKRPVTQMMSLAKA